MFEDERNFGSDVYKVTGPFVPLNDIFYYTMRFPNNVSNTGALTGIH